MVGVVIIAFVLLVALPLAFFALATAISMIASWSMTANAEAEHEGSELIDLNV
jgi:hypothetical protein